MKNINKPVRRFLLHFYLVKMSIIGVINASVEDTVYSEDNVKLQINKADVGNGTLFVTKE